jgi:hypothetical protein
VGHGILLRPSPVAQAPMWSSLRGSHIHMIALSECAQVPKRLDELTIDSVSSPSRPRDSMWRYEAGCICEKNASAFFLISSGVRSWTC